MHQPTERVLKVLRLAAESQSGIGLSEYSRILDIPKSTLLPILRTLSDAGFLSQNGQGEYMPGISLLSLSSAAANHFPVMEHIRLCLSQTAEALGETCYFGTLDKGDVLYLAKADANRPFRMLVTPGRRLPAYTTGIGKALLMEKTEAELRRMYPEGLKPLTENTITDFAILFENLEKARMRGFAEECEESMEEVRCFAVPVRKNGHIAAALSVCMPVFRFAPEKLHIIQDCIQRSAVVLQTLMEETDAEAETLF